MSHLRVGGLFLSIFAAASSGQTAYHNWTAHCPSSSWYADGWYQGGSPLCASGYINASPSNPTFTLYSALTAPTPSTEYEISSSFSHQLAYLGNGPVEFVQYLRSTIGADLRGNVGTFYAVSFSRTGNGPYTLNVYRRSSNTLTTLLSVNTGYSQAYFTVRTVMRTGGLYPGLSIRINGTNLRWYVNDAVITTGQPAVGLYDTPYLGTDPDGKLTANVLYAADTVAPNAVSTATLATSRFNDRVEMAWVPPTDDASGVRAYLVYRDGVLLGEVTTPAYVDYGITATTSYTYGLKAVDYHGNVSGMTNVPVPALPNATPNDPRRTGLKPTGAYWGAMGEQIDMLSGNLNYTLPLVKAVGRNGLGAGFSLNYNSQLWRQDGSNTVKLGADVGYGFGWRLLAGSIIPVWTDPNTISHYLFTDSSGAEYKLNVREGDTWTSQEGMYVWYNTASTKLYFPDGSFWLMGSVSGATEQDTGTRYPTVMQDVNGNQIVIRYQPAIGGSQDNTSARIKEIDDVRSTDQGGGVYRTYQFTYNADSIPHLTGITNTIGTGEAYTFAYTTSQTLSGPFSPVQNFGTAQMLQTVTVNGLSISHNFEYSAAGEMTKAVLPYGGEFRWQYSTFTFIDGLGGNRSIREVGTRQLLMSSGGTVYSYPITRNSSDSTRVMHSSAALTDPSGNGYRTWIFSTTADWTRGLQTQFDVANTSTGPVLSRDQFTWTQNAKGQPYIGTTLSTADPGQSYQAQSKTEQTLDGYGNLTQQKLYAYGNLSTPARTTTCSYTGYLINYVFRLPVTCSQTDGTATLTPFTNTYDTVTPTAVSPAPRLYDTSVTTTQRGHLRQSVTPYATVTYTRDVLGQVLTAQDNQGRRVDTQYSTATGVPTVITPNSNSNLNTTMSWNGFLGLTAQTQSNTYSASWTYDAYARPASTTTPEGATWTHTYTTSPPTKYSTSPTGVGGGMFTRTTFDGLGRPKKQESGGSGGAYSITDTEYAPCACSPVGKLYRTSQPYAPGGTIYWTTNTYDGLGRTVSVALPNGAGSTTYSYAGNTVTVTDPAGRWKKFTMDAFGNLIQVNEPNPAGGADFVTSYTYNLTNKLTLVSMPRGGVTQTRTFVYDTATQSRLLSQTFPENGTTTYTYNSDGTMLSKTDARNQRLQYSYDSNKRLTMVMRGTWNGTAFTEDTSKRTTFAYDTAPITNGGGGVAYGKLASVSYAGIWEYYQYTSRGLMSQKTLSGAGGSSRPLVATYNWSTIGQLYQVDYPLNGVYGQSSYADDLQVHQSFGYDAGSRLVSASAWVTDGLNNYNASVGWNAQYNGANQLTQLSILGVTENRTYNPLNQLTRITSTGNIDIEYRYSTTANDGRATSQKNWISGEEVQYTYDTLARLTLAETVGPQWGQSFSYDGWGNLLSKGVTKGAVPVMNLNVDGNTNRISSAGFGFDAAGNMTTMPFGGGSQTITYDHDSRVASVTNSGGTESYTYDTSNRRVVRNNGSQTEVTFYGIRGEKLGRYLVKTYSDGSKGFDLIEQYFYFGGRMTAKRPGSQFLTTGITRLTTDRLSSVGDGSTYYPYGEEKTVTANDKDKFATYYRDSVSGLDYALNRYYSSVYGRFLSSDPYRASGGPSDPGSWNRYAYVQGDPVNFTDPEGLFRSCPNRDGCRAQHIFDDLLRTDESMGGGGLDIGTGRGFAGRDGAGGGSRPSPMPPMEKKRFDEVFALALTALRDEDCSRLFNTDPGIVPKDPAAVLGTMMPGGPQTYGKLEVKPLAGDRSGQMVIDPTSATYISGRWIWTRGDIQIDKNHFMNGSLLDVVDTMIHELGHVFDMVWNMGGSRIIYDAHPDGTLDFLAQRFNAAQMAPCRAAISRIQNPPIQ